MKFKIKLESVYDEVNVNIISDQKYNDLAKQEFPKDDNLPIAFAEGSSIYIPESEKTDIPLFVHELIHAVKYIMQSRSIDDE